MTERSYKMQIFIPSISERQMRRPRPSSNVKGIRVASEYLPCSRVQTLKFGKANVTFVDCRFPKADTPKMHAAWTPTKRIEGLKIMRLASKMESL